MASSDTDAADLDLSSEDDHQQPATTAASLSIPAPGRPSSLTAEDEEEEEATGALSPDVQPSSTAEDDEEAARPTKAKSPRSSLDDGVSYASLLWDNSRVVVEQAEESRLAIKKMTAFFKDKAELDRYYAKALRKLVEKATPDDKPHTPAAPPSRANTASPSAPPTAASSSSLSPSSSSFELVLSSFRHLSLTLSANFDLLAAKVEEQILRPLLVVQSAHSASTKRITDDVGRMQRQLSTLTDALHSTKAASKKACQELQIWLSDHREKERAAFTDPHAPDVDLHSVFDELVQSFRWDADGMKKRTLAIDARYVQAVKALRSYRPQHEQQLRALLSEAQKEEESRRVQQLRVVQTYCDLQAAMFDKYTKSVRAVAVMQGQVNLRREMRGWIRERRGEGKVEPLPEYVMHKGHPRYDETEEEEERHDHDGITDNDDSEEEGEGEGEEEDEAEEDEEEDEEEEGDEEEEDDEEAESSRARKRRQRRRRQRGADELDEREDEKSEERIVAEKVLRVFINKAIGNRQAQTTGQPTGELQSPPSAALTTPLPRSALLPVSAAELGEGEAVDADEEVAARAIFSTRDGRNAFATIFSSLSPTFYTTRMPLSLFSAFDPPSTASLTLPPSSFAALTALTSLFLDASASSSHVEPALFVANVAHQIHEAHTPPPPTLPPTLPSSSTLPPLLTSPSDSDVMSKEEVAVGGAAATVPPHPLLSHLSSHPLLSDLRFFSTSLFASLHHHFAHSSLYIHRWHSDAEQEAVIERRRRLTFRLLSAFSRLMAECGVKRRERRRWVEKQLRVFDLVGKEWKEELDAVRRLNERGGGEVEEEGSDEEDGMLDIDGLRETGSDSEEERKAKLLRRKDEERQLMALQKAEERKKRRRTRAGGDGVAESPRTELAAVAAKRRREAEERKRKAEEEERKEGERKRVEEEAKKKRTPTPSFFASSLSFFRRSPSPTLVPIPSAAPVPPRAEGGKVTIPMPVASAVPLPPPPQPALPAQPLPAVKAKAKEAKSAVEADAAVKGGGEEGEKKKRVVRRVVRKKPAVSKEEDEKSEEKSSQPSATASVVSGGAAAAAMTAAVNEVDDMP